MERKQISKLVKRLGMEFELQQLFDSDEGAYKRFENTLIRILEKYEGKKTPTTLKISVPDYELEFLGNGRFRNKDVGKRKIINKGINPKTLSRDVKMFKEYYGVGARKSIFI